MGLALRMNTEFLTRSLLSRTANPHIITRKSESPYYPRAQRTLVKFPHGNFDGTFMTTGFYGTQHRSIQTNVEHIITRSVNIQKGRMFGQTHGDIRMRFRLTHAGQSASIASHIRSQRSIPFSAGRGTVNGFQFYNRR